MEKYNLYSDIAKRTNGEIYIGVVGPVRTGKSTFIKNFMDTLVIPEIKDEEVKKRTIDELPQSAAGKTIMTTEPKFVPQEAAVIPVDENSEIKIRLIDCVGYMTKGAAGHLENDNERMVKTPWFDSDIPFTKAAQIGTYKVIHEHSNIGIVITTDGSFGEIERENYIPPEEETILQLKKLNKPFVVLLNTSKPYSEESKKLAEEISKKNMVSVYPVNCKQMKKSEMMEILNGILLEFPIRELEFYIPKWVEMLSNDHYVKQELLQCIKKIMPDIKIMKDIKEKQFDDNCRYIKQFVVYEKNPSTGEVKIQVDFYDDYYYRVISEITGMDIQDEYKLIKNLKEFAMLKDSYTKLSYALEQVKAGGYGMVTPDKSEIILEEPEIIKNGNKYGVKIKAEAPAIHMIKTSVLTEIAPIVGNEAQANDLIDFIKESENRSDDGIWNTNIFGKSVEQIVEDGIQSKLNNLSEETKDKMQTTLQKITNESTGGVICIIL